VAKHDSSLLVYRPAPLIIGDEDHLAATLDQGYGPARRRSVCVPWFRQNSVS
jgi:hypothetical protein